MSFLEDLFVPSEAEATQASLKRTLTPEAMRRLVLTLRTAPDAAFNVGYGQNPQSLEEARPVLSGDRLRALLSLLAQHRPAA